MTANCANIIGLALQILAAVWLLWKAWHTSSALKKYPKQVTWDSLAPTLNKLAEELRTQFCAQAIGFILLVIGTGFSLWAILQVNRINHHTP